MADSRLFVDTAFVLALVDRRDKYHAEALVLANRIAGQPLLITDAVLLEIGNAMARGFKQEAAEIIDSFLNSDEVEVARLTPERFASAYALYRQYSDKEWTLVDCVSFVTMREAGIRQAVTFDHHFVQAGFEPLAGEPDR